MKKKRKSTTRSAAVKAGFRSGLEHRVWKNLKQRHVTGCAYETLKVDYVIPATNHTYTPDIILPNGIVIEVKGRLVKADRDKHLLIKEQHPELDIRFLFQSANNKIRKGSKTTYAHWCDKNDILWCEKIIPDAWLKKIK
tara:strand:- start:8713 stop:9129 length:417 start_codon:yes stop_codon:yes gene_type:complete